ncbi:MAG: CPBP family intramembrane glutamic endopeptidase [Nitriliruptorales bacterium]|nr:CPBP family intramembrane glutamic endopeptidase [Nitriliruptorales bacterium]
MTALALALTVALVGYSVVTNLDRSRESTYILRNLAIGVALAVVARAAGLSWSEMGLAREALDDGWRWGRLVAIAVAVGAAVVGALAGRVPAIDRALQDRRADLPPRQLAFHALVRIPIGTAAFEEFAFRGVLLAAFTAAWGQGWGVAASSLAFGLWHIGPARLTARINHRDDPRQLRREVVGAVALTTLGGVAFALLRLGSGSLLAPVLAHTSTNVFGLLVAATVQQTSRR